MGSVEWQMLAVGGFAFAILLGSVLLLWARRSINTVIMAVAGAFQVVGFAGMIIGQQLMRSGLTSVMAMSPDPYLLYRRINEIGGLVFIGGLVLFAYAFVKFGLRQMALERRAEELEGLVKGLKERMGGDQ